MRFPIIYVCLFMGTPYLLIFSYLRLCHDPKSEIKSVELDAPESISKAVASLPPEQMFELMKQMTVGGGIRL